MAGSKSLFLILGWTNVVLGMLGILLPLLPTTPFLLLAVFLFAKSSERWHHWLLRHRLLGPYIHAFQHKNGLTRAQKLRMAASFTVLLGISVYLAPRIEVRAGLVFLWLTFLLILYRAKPAANLKDPTAAPLGAPSQALG